MGFGWATDTDKLFREWHEHNPDYVDTRYDFPLVGKQQPITLFLLALALVFLALNYAAWPVRPKDFYRSKHTHALCCGF